MISENIERIRKTLPGGVKLVAVSKYRPVEQLLAAYDAGQRAFAENRPLEFQAKVGALPEDIEWHFIGHLQTNKLKYVLPYASLVHSIDSEHLLDAVQRWCNANDMCVNVLLEMHIGCEDTKQGMDEKEIFDILRRKDKWPYVRICGLMGMASHTDDEDAIRADFERIRKCFEAARSLEGAGEEFRELSIGMSDDYLVALDYSPTMVRIGSAIFNE